MMMVCASILPQAIAAHVREDNRPKAFRFRHGLDGFSVEERRAKLSKYQSTAGWATKVVNALEILEVMLCILHVHMYIYSLCGWFLYKL